MLFELLLFVLFIIYILTESVIILWAFKIGIGIGLVLLIVSLIFLELFGDDISPYS